MNEIGKFLTDAAPPQPLQIHPVSTPSLQHCNISGLGATSQLLDVGGVIPRVPVGRLLPKQSAQNKTEVAVRASQADTQTRQT